MIVSIGLEDDVIQEIRRQTKANIVAYPNVPKIYTQNGVAHVESDRAMDLFLKPELVLWYGYFPDAHEQRMALAISDTPTFPAIRETLPWDDKMWGAAFIGNAGVRNRSYFPRNVRHIVPELVGPGKVVKWGNEHCGEGKVLSEQVDSCPREPLYSEDFVVGESYRILYVGNYVSMLKYESDDWRKNVNSRVTKCADTDNTMLLRAEHLMFRSDLKIAGIDFVLSADGEPHMLEVNTYPSLEEDAEAKANFIEMACTEIRSVL